MEKATSTIQGKYPTSRILLSTILPRNDNLNKRAHELNDDIKSVFGKNEKITVIEHKNTHHAYHLKVQGWHMQLAQLVC